MCEIRGDLPGASQTHVFSPRSPEPTGFWPKPPAVYRGGKRHVKAKVDRQLMAAMERIWLVLEEKGVMPAYGRWTEDKR